MVAELPDRALLSQSESYRFLPPEDELQGRTGEKLVSQPLRWRELEVHPDSEDLEKLARATLNFQRMVRGMTRLREISENAAEDQLNVENYVKELSDVFMVLVSNRSTCGSSTCSRQLEAEG